MDNKIRTSQLARSIASTFGILAAQALILVQSAKSELEITSGWLSEREAGELEAIIAQDLRN